MKIIKAGRAFFILLAAVFILMILGVCVSQAATATCSISIDGKIITSDASPEIISDRSFVPVATVVKNLNGTASWDEKTQKVTLKYGSKTVILYIGSKTASVNGTSYKLDAAPYIKVVDENGGGRTMVPLRFVGESFGFNVDWDSDSRTAIINTAAASRDLATITSTNIYTNHSYNKDNSKTYTMINIAASESLKDIAHEGQLLESPYRYYIDFEYSNLGTDAAKTKSIDWDKSYVCSVRTGLPEDNTVRVVIDLKDGVKPIIEYSSNGKVMSLYFPETYVYTSAPQTDPKDPANPGTGENTDPVNPEEPEQNMTSTGLPLAENDTETVKGSVRHDTLSEYDPYADGKLVVCIDPGHGTSTAGKRSTDESLLEWEFNRSVAYKLKDLLEANGITTVMTVGKNEAGDPSLASRCETANSAGDVDLYVSIHANAFLLTGEEWNSAYGWEVYCYKKGGVSELVAKAIEKATKSVVTGIYDRGVKTANFYVIKNTEMPSVLIEHGFYTNLEEVELLKSDEYRDQLAQADCKGILDFFKSLK